MAQYMIDNIASPIDFQESDPLKRILQNAKNLLMCEMGEVPYDRYKGFDASLYDLPMPKLRRELLPELDRCMTWEPGVEVAGAQAWLMEDGKVYIQVALETEQYTELET